MGIFQQFPYSNFHEFNLDQIIKIMRQMQDEWEATKTEWASYKDFIDNYFENLDVSEEVLSAMRIFAADGTLSAIMDPTIASETADWLALHITQPTTPAVDSSLTVQGAAADAKVTGDYIDELKDDIEFNLFASKHVIYNGMDKYGFDATASRPSFFRKGNEFGLNGSTSSTAYIKLSEDGATNYATSNATAQAWPKNVTLENDHIYRCRFFQRAGTYSATTMTIRMYSDDGYITVNKDVDRIITGTGETRNVVLLISTGSSFTDAEFGFVIEDVTEALLTNAKYPVGAINEVYEMAKKCFTGYFADAEAIPANSDLDNYTTPGNYKIETDADAFTISNMPPNQRRGRIFVMQPYASGRYMQFFFSGSDGYLFVRRYTNQWYPWKMIYTDTLSELQPLSDLPVNSAAVARAIGNIQANVSSTMKLGYSWWVNNRAVDSYGNLYFGYITEYGMCGVGCRFPDGSVAKHDLYPSEENDDHNAPSVIIVKRNDNEYVCVIGSTGHNTDNKMHVYLANDPNSIDTTFADKTINVVAPSGYLYQNTYSQAFFDTFVDSGITYNRITNFFRIRQRATGQQTYHMVWVCAMSDDYGDTWKFYSVFTVAEDDTLFYMASANTDKPWIKRIVLQPNTALINYKPISAGLINIAGKTIQNNSGTQIGTLLEFDSTTLAYNANVTSYDSFTSVVPYTTNYLYRILDVWEDDTSTLTFLYCVSTDPIDTSLPQPHRFVNNWTLYRYKSGTSLEVGHLGGAFYKASHYVPGAAFYNDDDHIIYSQNNSETITVTVEGQTVQRQLQDGPHSLHIVPINNNVVGSDLVIKTSSQTLARPVRYDKGSIMMLTGQYREGQGTAFLTWHFGIQFIDAILNI